ncbi:hypothetical protein H6G54_05235 [Anabaena cylindrica FACHB-243]|uniref:Uncharacterized protein n=1 Tax=Anabaena cylindrica (strain ATCC 27899 / PCC 7122) TaxID=272123 RepID=K9ZNL6_ANACC|nr:MULTISPECIES: hypothetical protein [Anabaena]AFZ60823.1 hypothetical protein Anacy_5511 [Anabaena cylindrica PCC 7122]MBD2417123.1 hypothetical protein [Anabaena cylindrica FACHB-243]MBY5280819.1 hypothetical protein [Anabaena sp. CCAP 1446/1C]MBY5307095.1 hypothetical protein [Anabaena sp. CCAP 1446/1C]MCM2406824.1 hypothetical protein [Anabaena sp. CCAP 1446/1C]
MNYPTIPQLQTPNQTNYSKSKLELLTIGAGAIALTLTLLSGIGDGIKKRDVCFVPANVKNDSCSVDKIAQIPEPYFIANQTKTSNPNYNPYAFLSSENLVTIRHIPADNPNKSGLGLGAILAGISTMVLSSKLKDKLNLIRPHYRATVQLEAHKAVAQLQLSKDLIDYSANELLKHIKHIKSAEARLTLLANISPVQVNLLLMAMTATDYQEFGYLLDGGKSFDKFLPVPQLPSNDNQITPETVGACSGFEWIKNFLSTTCLLWGNQGSGKSWMARYLLREKAAMGYKLVVCDPNSNGYEWQGVRLINTYSEIEKFMEEYVTEVMGRYAEFGKSNISEEEWRANLWKEGKAVSVLCEEVSTYADFIQDKELLAKFFKVALTLSRKQEMPVLIVAHNNTQSCLGDIKGMHKLIERSQQLQPLATTDPTTKQPVASGRGLIKIENSNQWLEVNIPRQSEKIRNFAVKSDRTPEPTTNNNSVVESLEKLFAAKTALSPEAKLLLDYLTRTEKTTVTASYIQPNFKVNGDRFSSEQLKIWLSEIGNCGYGCWDGNVLKLE